MLYYGVTIDVILWMDNIHYYMTIDIVPSIELVVKTAYFITTLR